MAHITLGLVTASTGLAGSAWVGSVQALSCVAPTSLRGAGTDLLAVCQGCKEPAAFWTVPTNDGREIAVTEVERAPLAAVREAQVNLSGGSGLLVVDMDDADTEPAAGLQHNWLGS